jgi:pyrroline-5-carboxylate reductase
MCWDNGQLAQEVRMKLGFVGTGAITESVVRGLVKAENDFEVIAVSPRNAEVAARSETARASPERSFEELRTDYSTKGGLNEQVFDLFKSHGGAAAVTGGLEAAFSRLAPRRGS